MANKSCRALTEEEIKAIERTFIGTKWELRNRTLLHLGICTGFRISELVSLRVQDVFKFGKVLTEVSRPKRMMKGKRKGRSKKIFPEAKEILRKWIRQIKEKYNGTRKSFLFLSREGGAIRRETANRILRKAAVEADIPVGSIGTHSLRKTFALRMYNYYWEKTEDGARLDIMRMLQMELGHADISTTYSYMEFMLDWEKPDDLFKKYSLVHADESEASLKAG